MVSETEYYIYTMDSSLLIKTGSGGSWALGENVVPVFKTLVTRKNTNADWVTQGSLVGYAKAAYYEGGNERASIDPDTWAAGTP